MTGDYLLRHKEAFNSRTAEEILDGATAHLREGIAFATSMGAEDQVIMDMISRRDLDVKIFTLDTGRLFKETYDLIAETEKRYGRKIEIYFPDNKLVEDIVYEHGINLFYKSVELRKKCCHARKIEPLRRALSGYSGWICGLRREQSVTRGELEAIEWDKANQMAKINPLHNWTNDQVWKYIKEHDVPYNKLHDEGFLSIGCSCCTRAAKPGEDIRAGRWWWENPEHKECGLDWVDGKLQRTKHSTTGD